MKLILSFLVLVSISAFAQTTSLVCRATHSPSGNQTQLFLQLTHSDQYLRESKKIFENSPEFTRDSSYTSGTWAYISRDRKISAVSANGILGINILDGVGAFSVNQSGCAFNGSSATTLFRVLAESDSVILQQERFDHHIPGNIVRFKELPLRCMDNAYNSRMTSCFIGLNR